MNRQPSTMNVELLIMKVKENSAIYDASDENHGNEYFIASVWGKIGEDLGISEDQLKEKWHQLHSMYMQVKRYEENKPSGSGKAKTKWPYYDLMSFLDQFSQSRDTAGNARQEPPHQPPSLRDELAYETATDENEPVENPPTPAANSAVVDEVQYLPELPQINSSWSDENDPDRIFLLSLLPLMKQLTPADNMDLKLNTLQFLRSKTNPNSTGHNNWLQSQPPQIHQNQHQYHQLSESDLTIAGSPALHSFPFGEHINMGPSTPYHQCTKSITLILSILFSIIFIAFAVIILIKITSSKWLLCRFISSIVNYLRQIVSLLL